MADQNAKPQGDPQLEKEQNVNDGSVADKQATEDAVAEFKKQIEELRRSADSFRERATQAEREKTEALRRYQERDAQVAQSQSEVGKVKLDAINAGIAAANSEAESAQRDYMAAVTAGDLAAQSEANRRLARAESNLTRLEDGKSTLEENIKREKERPVVRQEQSKDPLDQMPHLPSAAKTWLRDHPECLTDPKKNERLQALHYVAIAEGHEAYSPEYFGFVETKMGMRKAPVVPKQDDVAASDDSGIVSAPVSREGTTATGKPSGEIRLSVAQREAAKIAGIPEKDYAIQVRRLMEAKANGQYTGGQ